LWDGVLVVGVVFCVVWCGVEEAPLKLREQLEQIERDLLLACLRRNAGKQSLAARDLGLPRRTLIYRMGRRNIHIVD
ncbi:helix-turn-helix domain-containing protein, partial [Pseudomonas aeruginosa]|uniref:helix-turn-helix domain-containing protein n=1 Tax=Pseudomonas aeruginosa TaxID=287 RepID=UPI003CC551A8